MSQLSEKDKRRFGLISFVILIMVGFILVIGRSLTGEGDAKTALLTGERDHAEAPMRAEWDAFTDPHVMPVEEMKELGKSRSLVEYYDRRAYSGAPPIIPHPVAKEVGKDQSCLGCHRNGGYVSEWKAHTPVTPHPDFVSCRQCHVPQGKVALFKGTEWMSVKPPKLGQSALPDSPPPIPHPRDLRTNCLACHYGAGAVQAIKTDHPERQNCRQCHVFQKTPFEFERKVAQ